MFQAIQDIFAFWVNQEIMDEVGIKSIDTKRGFHEVCEGCFQDGRFDLAVPGKTYAFNELAQFVNMFGDYFDWTKGKQGSGSSSSMSGC